MGQTRLGGGGRRPGRRQRWSLRKKLLVWGSSALAGVIVLCAIGAGVVWHHLNGNIRTQDAQLKPSALDGKQDIVFIGSDSRAGANQALGGGDVAGARSDTVMVFDAPADRRQGTEVSIPRDSMVQIPDCLGPNGQAVPANFGMFNSAFSEGGAPCTVKTVRSLTGLNLTHYIAIDFEGVVGVVNALGGVKVCMTQAVDDRDSGLKLPAGTTTLNGTQALAFVRVRHSVGDGSDLERIQRQQYFLDQLERQVRSAGLITDPVRLYKVLDAATQSITTDPGLANVTDLYNLAQTLNGIPTGKMTYVTVPNGPYPANPEQVVWTEPNATNLWNSLITGQSPVGGGAVQDEVASGAPGGEGAAAGGGAPSATAQDGTPSSAPSSASSAAASAAPSSAPGNAASAAPEDGVASAAASAAPEDAATEGGATQEPPASAGDATGGDGGADSAGNEATGAAVAAVPNGVAAAGGRGAGGGSGAFASPAEQALSRFDSVMRLMLFADTPSGAGGSGGAGSSSVTVGTTTPGGADVGTCAVN